MPLVVGQLVGRYRVDALVGRGGMGEVYRAWDAQLNRAVALKVMRDDLDEDEESKVEASSRFAREARMAARFVSAHFCAIFEVFEHEGMPVLVMEWLEGTTLRARIHDNTLSLAERSEWITILARGLGEAHAKGVVHRDFKPGNVLVTKDAALKIVDFGLAKRLRVASANASPTETSGFETKTGMILGTERYMAPEQAAGAGYDERTDQFAWAIVAYELLSRTHPQNATPNAAFPMSPPRPLAELGLGIGVRTSNAIARALSLLPNDRFPSMNDIVVELEATDKEEAPPPKTARMPLIAPPQEDHPAPKARTPATKRKDGGKTTTFLASTALVLIAGGVVIAFLVMKRGSQVNVHSADAADSSSASPTVLVAPKDAAEEDADAVATLDTASAPTTLAAPPTRTVAPPSPPHSSSVSGDAGESPRSALAMSGRAPGARAFWFATAVTSDLVAYEKGDLIDAVTPKKPAVMACYMRPDFDGSNDQIVIHLRDINASGRPGKIVAVAASSTAPRFLACIESVFRNLTLPPPTGTLRDTKFYINVSR